MFRQVTPRARLERGSDGWHGRPFPVQDGPMIGVVLVVLAVVVVLPVFVLISGGVASALLGYLLKDEAETAHASSELLDTNV